MKYFEIWQVWYGTYLSGAPSRSGGLVCRKISADDPKDAVELFKGVTASLEPVKDQGRPVYKVGGGLYIANPLSPTRLRELDY